MGELGAFLLGFIMVFVLGYLLKDKVTEALDSWIQDYYDGP